MSGIDVAKALINEKTKKNADVALQLYREQIISRNELIEVCSGLLNVVKRS